MKIAEMNWLQAEEYLKHAGMTVQRNTANPDAPRPRPRGRGWRD